MSRNLPKDSMYATAAGYYDTIYETLKDYRKESKEIKEIIELHKKSDGKKLLDVACGTGQHAFFLRKFFKVEGLDVQPEMLAVAGRRNPGVTFHKGDMRSFKLPKKFDAVTCLFSSIGYVKTLTGLRTAVQNMVDHLQPGGVIIVEPWLTPKTFKRRHVGGVYVNQPVLKIARINSSKVKGRVSRLDFHYLVGTPRGVRHFITQERLGLFSLREYMDAFRRSGVQLTYDRDGLMGRGLFIGVKPLNVPTPSSHPLK